MKTWDKWITAFAAGVFPITSWVVAGLNNRLQWTGILPLGYHLGGLLVMIIGYALFLWAMACNAFFSEGVRIQTECSHSVTSSGR